MNKSNKIMTHGDSENKFTDARLSIPATNQFFPPHRKMERHLYLSKTLQCMKRSRSADASQKSIAHRQLIFIGRNWSLPKKIQAISVAHPNQNIMAAYT
jgi:hypothetical protein